MLSFNATEFSRREYAPRTAEMPIPEDLLQHLGGMPPGEGPDAKAPVPKWQVRGMTGEEMDRAEEAHSGLVLQIYQQVLQTVGNGLDSGAPLANVNQSSPSRAKRLIVLQSGSVEPKLDSTAAIQICDHFPIFAALLERKIYDLTGLGSVPGKPKGSTAGPK